MFESNLREKSKAAHIDAENRDASFTGQPCGIQHGAVTAEDQEHIRFLRQLRLLDAAAFVQQRGRRIIQDDIDFPVPQPIDDCVNRRLDFRELGLS